MSVLVKGMEMPKNCIDCAFGWNGWCHRINSRAFVEVDMRRHDCPLIEVPPPHGNLIDADAFFKDICNSIENMTKLGIGVDADYLWAKLNDALDNAPTVIPADKDGET